MEESMSFKANKDSGDKMCPVPGILHITGNSVTNTRRTRDSPKQSMCMYLDAPFA